jgi:hypothetical protein
VVQPRKQDDLQADEDDCYESEAEEDYLNQLEGAFTTEPQEE